MNLSIPYKNITEDEWIAGYNLWVLNSKRRKDEDIPPPFKELDKIIETKPEEDKLKRFDNLELDSPPKNDK